MHGTSTALVILVPEAEDRFGAFRRAHDSAARNGSLAHITLLYPFLRERDLQDTAKEKLDALFRQHAAFSFSLTKMARFRGVLYLAPEPAAPFITLTQAIWAQFPDHPPYGGRFSRITPHLQLAQDDDEAALDRWEAGFLAQHGPDLPQHCHATAVHLIDERLGRWHIRWAFPLGASPNPGASA